METDRELKEKIFGEHYELLKKLEIEHKRKKQELSLSLQQYQQEEIRKIKNQILLIEADLRKLIDEKSQIEKDIMQLKEIKRNIFDELRERDGDLVFLIGEFNKRISDVKNVLERTEDTLNSIDNINQIIKSVDKIVSQSLNNAKENLKINNVINEAVFKFFDDLEKRAKQLNDYFNSKQIDIENDIKAAQEEREILQEGFKMLKKYKEDILGVALKVQDQINTFNRSLQELKQQYGKRPSQNNKK